MFFFQLRGLADRVLERRDFAFIRRLWRQWSPGWNIPEDELEHVIATFREPGVAKAALIELVERGQPPISNAA